MTRKTDFPFFSLFPAAVLAWRSFITVVACLAITYTSAVPAADDEAGEVRIVVLSRGTVAEIDEVKRPNYPRSAAQRGVEGWVRLRFSVDPEGRTQNIEVYQSAGHTGEHQRIERAAVRALEGWTFEPATLDGEPVAQDDLVQLITFQLRRSEGGVTSRFRSHMAETLEALADGDTDRAWAGIEQVEKEHQFLMLEYAYLAMMKAMAWQESGDDERALAEAELARLLFNETAPEEALNHVLRMTVLLNARANRFPTALARFEELVTSGGALSPDDPLNRIVGRMRAALAADEPLVTEGKIAPCARCRDETHFYRHELNRNRFQVTALEGTMEQALESLHISCPPAHVTLAWEPDVVWKLEGDPAGCEVTVYGAAGVRLRLVELAESPGSDGNPPTAEE